MLATAIAVSACADGDMAGGVGGHVVIDVAPLSLTGVTEATYRVTVLAGGATVWTRDDLTTSGYGDGSGGLSYVGTCDADAGSNTVRLELLTLSDANGPIPASSWRNPTPIARDVPCDANTDVAVDFDLTVIRTATQGFFDTAITFEDIFCSAKLDCVGDDGTSDLDLLFDPHTGARGPTAVLGFACTAGPGQDTYLHMDDVVVECEVGGPFVVEVAGVVGNQNPAFPGPPNDLDLFFQTAIFRGNELIGSDPPASKAYWNVALGLNAPAFANRGACTLVATASATDGELAGGVTPEGQRWPLITWEVPVSDAGGRTCAAHELGADTGVAAVYSEVSGHAFHASYARSSEAVVVHTAAPAAPPTALLFATATTTRPADATMACPAGYRRVGSWKAGKGAADTWPEASDYTGAGYDVAWLWLCTTDAARLTLEITGSSCGGPTTWAGCTAAGGALLGTWHVGGSSCDGVAAAVASDGTTTVDAGWIGLCGRGGALATAEVRVSDCPGGSYIACAAGSSFAGAWHTDSDTTACPSGVNGTGYATGDLPAGWMHLCRRPL
ncbi:MAG: hypothetical protein CVU56_04675 [Deltaproteobacteria bacterium HGW-Deltaproteobacteria-14]|nr:MAG: hypothetical protein CVU56_04675 [Deltaproteobacteria bacterium HGW-Deltaproteobacteria-14]